MPPRAHYRPRIIDTELDALMPEIAAISLDGPKGVGKTSTARQRAAETLRLDDPAVRAVYAADPARIRRLTKPVFLDEWQEYPQIWNEVRHAVDDGAPPGSYLLAGSATPTERIHSGAGRIIPLRMRPQTLPERKATTATVSFAALLEGTKEVSGHSPLDLDGYLDEICASGMPGINTGASWQATQARLDGYLERLFDHEVAAEGGRRPSPTALRQWAAAYAAASATTTSYDKLLDASTPGEASKPAKTTAQAYREVLARLWFLDPLPAWLPASTHLKRLGQAPKHNLADPGFAARLLDLTPAQLKARPQRHAGIIAQLFESLAAMSVRVFAQTASARVAHLRLHGGSREIDLIITSNTGSVLAIEVKLAPVPEPSDLKHLHWLRGEIGDRVANLAVLTTGAEAYTRDDGVHIVPLGALGA